MQRGHPPRPLVPAGKPGPAPHRSAPARTAAGPRALRPARGAACPVAPDSGAASEAMSAALGLAIGSALCFGTALLSARLGLRSRGARAAAVISVPTATAMLLLVAPFVVDWTTFDARAALLFAAVGLVFPAFVTLLGFRSTVEVGPTVTGAVAGTSPLFALAAAALWLGEAVPVQAAWASVGVGLGVAALSWQRSTRPRDFALQALGWAAAAAALRGGSQALARGGLAAWPEPVAAAAIGYVMSSLVLLTAYTLGSAGAAAAAGRNRETDEAAGTATTAATARTSARPAAVPFGPRVRGGRRWMMLTGLLNGGGVLLMYAALGRAPVSLVAPVVASYPLVTAAGAWLLPGGERPDRLRLLGVALIVASVAFAAAAPRPA